MLAHLSDPHLSSPGTARPVDLLNKRLLGYLSWRRRRRHRHTSHTLESLLEDLAETTPDHVAVTGDLTHIGLPDEFRQAAEWLRRVGPPERVTVIPGNHDTYVAEPWLKTFSAWAPYLAGDDGAAPSVHPILRVRGPAALIGLSSARPSAPFLAVGTLGRDQLNRLDSILERTGKLGLFRIILVHHPPVPGSISWRKRLTDARALAEVLARRGAELILHGHGHRSMAHTLIAGERRIPALGVPAASYSGSNPHRAARYRLIRVRRQPGGWTLLLTDRIHSVTDGRFVPAEEKELFVPTPAP